MPQENAAGYVSALCAILGQGKPNWTGSEDLLGVGFCPCTRLYRADAAALLQPRIMTNVCAHTLATNSVHEVGPPRTHDAQRGLSQLQIEQMEGGQYHGMYVASDALVKLLGMRAENARSCAESLLR